MPRALTLAAAIATLALTAAASAQSALVALDRASSANDFPIATASPAPARAAAIYIAPGNPETVRVAANAFAGDVARVTGVKPRILTSLTSLAAPLPRDLILVGVLGHSPEIDALVAARRLNVAAVSGQWEAAATAIVRSPMHGVKRALVIAGSDRRGAAYALFAISRAMGVSPWNWWADVPVAHHTAVYVRAGVHIQSSPSVRYRGIFLNDEDWGLRPWAAKKMAPTVDSAGGSGEQAKGNIGPHTYARIFELLLRLHADSLWPAMHSGSLAFNAVPENAKLADDWGIVMGSSHSEALLRNNVGEWDEKTDGPWNYQLNAPAMNAYWSKRLVENGRYENFYTVGLRGVHDSGLEATGTPQVKAKLVEDVMTEQRKLLAAHVNPDVAKVPQIIWLYKESLDLYRVGMKVPPDVTLGWTDDNYGYLRELPNAEEQKRPGGSGVYYHVSYWGAPHDYLWLCATPPALIQEEMTKAWDHGARKYWVLNVGDLKPAELDIDYFMQLATDEPRMAAMGQHEFLTQWFAEQFPIFPRQDPRTATDMYSRTGPDTPYINRRLADIMTRYYALNFIRKPEFMGFNGYNDGIQRTEFNPLAWGPPAYPAGPGESQARAAEWSQLSRSVQTIAASVPPDYASAFFELVGYPVEAAAAMNEKLLAADLTYLDAHNRDDKALVVDFARAHAAYDTIQSLTARYNSLEGGKWDGMMSDHPHDRHVFEMPRLATAADASAPLPAAWSAGGPTCQDGAKPSANSRTASLFIEEHCTVSIDAAHFTRSSSGNLISRWRVLADLGISGSSVVFGQPGRTSPFGPISTAAAAQTSLAQSGSSPWLDYDFTTTSSGPATLALHLLPTFPIDSDHRLRYAVSLDGAAPIEMNGAALNAAASTGVKSAGSGDGPSTADWSANVLRNSAIATVPLGALAPGLHTLRLLYRDPGVVFEHLVLTFPGAPPAYPVPPETN